VSDTGHDAHCTAHSEIQAEVLQKAQWPETQHLHNTEVLRQLSSHHIPSHSMCVHLLLYICFCHCHVRYKVGLLLLLFVLTFSFLLFVVQVTFSSAFFQTCSSVVVVVVVAVVADYYMQTSTQKKLIKSNHQKTVKNIKKTH
jgi:hypothetical protein